MNHLLPHTAAGTQQVIPFHQDIEYRQLALTAFADSVHLHRPLRIAAYYLPTDLVYPAYVTPVLPTGKLLVTEEIFTILRRRVKNYQFTLAIFESKSTRFGADFETATMPTMEGRFRQLFEGYPIGQNVRLRGQAFAFEELPMFRLVAENMGVSEGQFVG